MYWDYKEVTDELTCSLCNHSFVDVVKILPECGNSICGECFEALSSDLTETSEFKCKLCNYQPHKMPAEGGLPNNNLIMKLIKKKPTEKALNEKTKQLKTSIEDIQQRIGMLKSYDRVQGVNAYCDVLESEVRLTVESSIKHLYKLQDDLILTITSYRQELLDFSASPPSAENEGSADKVTKDLESWSQDFQGFEKYWTDYFAKINISLSDDKISDAQATANNYKMKLMALERSVRDQTFKSKFLSFNENQKFTDSSDYLGKLELINDATRSTSIKFGEPIISNGQNPPSLFNFKFDSKPFAAAKFPLKTAPAHQIAPAPAPHLAASAPNHLIAPARLFAPASQNDPKTHVDPFRGSLFGGLRK